MPKRQMENGCGKKSDESFPKFRFRAHRGNPSFTSPPPGGPWEGLSGLVGSGSGREENGREKHRKRNHFKFV